MPVTNAHLDEPMPWTQRGKTGMKIVENPDRPSGTLANRAGIAKNVAGLTDEERAQRGDPPPILTVAPTPTHVTVTDPSHYKRSNSPAAVVFRGIELVIGAFTGAARLAGRARPKGR
jgi:hypothetical protein